MTEEERKAKTKDYNKAYRTEHWDELRIKKAAYAQTHKAQKSAYDKIYDAIHSEKKQAAAAQWVIEHEEEVKERGREWYKTHKDAIITKGIQWRSENKEKVRLTQRAWDKAHPEKVKEHHRKDKAQRRGLESYPLNSWFLGSDGHHIDKRRVIYIPEVMHDSVKHNVWTGKNMEKINFLAMQWARLPYALD